MVGVYFQKLSGRQRMIGIVGLLIILAVVVIGIVLQHDAEEAAPPAVVLEMTLSEAAHALGIKGGDMAVELGLPRETAKDVPMSDLGVDDESLSHAVTHLLGHTEETLKYFLFAALSLWGFIFLVMIGRPDKASMKEKKTWYPRLGYIIPLALAVIFCGFLLGKSPNPMEGVVKLLKSIFGVRDTLLMDTAAFLFFVGLAVIGNKLVCGWACPFGALQELIYSIPVLKKIKKKKPPFWVTNTVRGVLFVVAVLVMAGLVGGAPGLSIYHLVNPFNLFGLSFETWTILAVVIGALVVGLFFYRPFCQFICPFGFVSWLAERVSLFRVRVDHDACTECGACIRACPLTAAKARVEKTPFGADCFSCGRCLNVCPTDAIRYGWVFSKKGEESGKVTGKKQAV
ncbi:MAG: 4Fe-4S binding protein [Deltaproteobacteria bacterium]|nr:4Fe-4S binding protein [Candidatus Zymogenaceae bacterium]